MLIVIHIFSFLQWKNGENNFKSADYLYQKRVFSFMEKYWVARDLKIKVTARLNLSKIVILCILYEYLRTNIVLARLIPRLISYIQMQQRVVLCGFLIDFYNSNHRLFYSRQEIMILHWDTLSKKKSMEWRKSDKVPLRKQMYNDQRKTQKLTFFGFSRYLPQSL